MSAHISEDAKKAFADEAANCMEGGSPTSGFESGYFIQQAINRATATLEKERDKLIDVFALAMGGDVIDGCSTPEMAAVLTSQRDNARNEADALRQQLAEVTQERDDWKQCGMTVAMSCALAGGVKSPGVADAVKEIIAERDSLRAELAAAQKTNKELREALGGMADAAYALKRDSDSQIWQRFHAAYAHARLILTSPTNQPSHD